VSQFRCGAGASAIRQSTPKGSITPATKPHPPFAVLAFDAVARGQIEAIDVIPPELHIGDAHVHHEVVDIVNL
jgi:hypothetical protein